MFLERFLHMTIERLHLTCLHLTMCLILMPLHEKVYSILELDYINHKTASWLQFFKFSNFYVRSNVFFFQSLVQYSLRSFKIIKIIMQNHYPLWLVYHLQDIKLTSHAK